LAWLLAHAGTTTRGLAHVVGNIAVELLTGSEPGEFVLQLGDPAVEGCQLVAMRRLESGALGPQLPSGVGGRLAGPVPLRPDRGHPGFGTGHSGTGGVGKPIGPFPFRTMAVPLGACRCHLRGRQSPDLAQGGLELPSSGGAERSLSIVHPPPIGSLAGGVGGVLPPASRLPLNAVEWSHGISLDANHA